MADDIKYPCVMQATGRSSVIVNITAYGIGIVIGTGNGTGNEKYSVGYHCTT